MGLCCSRRNGGQRGAFVKSSTLRWIAGDLQFKNTLPRHDYIQRLIELFRRASSPETMRRVVFDPDTSWREYVSASWHLPGAYAEFFPCPYCTYKDEEGRAFSVEVFHFPNVHEPNICATVSFIMPADAFQLKKPTGSRVEVEVTNRCPNAPIVVDRSSRVVLLTDTDIFIEVLRFVPRSALEKILLVSRRWRNVISGAEGSLRQRRLFWMYIMFWGDSRGMLSIRFVRRVRLGKWRNLRVLTTRGLSQALIAVRLHLRNAFVEGVIPEFLIKRNMDDMDPPIPREMLVDIALPERIEWLMSLLRSMPPNSEIRSWDLSDDCIGFNNLLTLASGALEPHKSLGCVQQLTLGPFTTWSRLASLLNQSSIRAFSEVTIGTPAVFIDTSELRDIVSSWQSRKLHVYVSSDMEPQDELLTLPARIIRDFLALREANSFVDEFSLRLRTPDNVAFTEMPDVHEATDRRKRFRFNLKGEHTTVRVRVYENPAARAYLSVVTFDHFRRTVFFFNGNVSLTELKHTLQRPYNFV